MTTTASRRRTESSISGDINVVIEHNKHWRDTGCDVAPSCFACPLPQCKHDDPTWYHEFKVAKRDAEVLRLCDSGLSKTDIAVELGVSRRTVHRATRRTRERRAA